MTTNSATDASNEEAALLSIDDLSVDFEMDGMRSRALNHFGYKLQKGKTLAIVGESGCGKTVHALSLLGLLPPKASVVSGTAHFNGEDIISMSRERLRKMRGAEIAMIFQDPMTSLNPVMTVGEQIAEAVITHQHVSPEEAFRTAAEMLGKVGITQPERRLAYYPHQFSGGMRQRVMIAMALACRPKILIADEPTTALDVTIQAQILHLMRSLQQETGMALVLITHNMGIVADMADDVIVVYAGRKTESAPVEQLFANPLHPYTKGLLSSVPPPHEKRDLLYAIPGVPPLITSTGKGCAFAPRCEYADDRCREKEPPEFRPAPGRTVNCWRMEGVNK